jgi:hypothetical protein
MAEMRRDDRGMTTGVQPFRIHPIAAAELDAVRSSGVDVSGNPVVSVTDAVGAPLRCCLRNIRKGRETS